MTKPHVYINLAQCLAISGVVIVAVSYMNIMASTIGIQKKKFHELIKDKASNVANVIARPFAHYF